MFVQVLVSIIFFVAGLSFLVWFIAALRNQNAVLESFAENPQKLKGAKAFWWIWAGITLGSSLCEWIALFMIWSGNDLGMLVGAIPFAFFGLSQLKNKLKSVQRS